MGPLAGTIQWSRPHENVTLVDKPFTAMTLVDTVVSRLRGPGSAASAPAGAP